MADLCKDILLLANKCGGYSIHDSSLEAEADTLAASLLKEEEEEEEATEGGAGEGASSLKSNDDQIGLTTDVSSPILSKPGPVGTTQRRSRTSSFAKVSQPCHPLRIILANLSFPLEPSAGDPQEKT